MPVTGSCQSSERPGAATCTYHARTSVGLQKPSRALRENEPAHPIIRRFPGLERGPRSLFWEFATAFGPLQTHLSSILCYAGALQDRF